MAEKNKQQVSDEQLLERYQRGDRQAFVDLIKRYEKELFNFLLRFLGKASLAEDVFQDTFLQVHLSAASFETSRRFRPWLYTIASNKARDVLRSQSRRPTVQLTATDDQGGDSHLWDHLLREEETPVAALEQKQEAQLVRQVVAELPEHLREILILAYFKQISYKEMAEALEVPLGTVKSRLHAAVAAFGKRFAKYTGEVEKRDIEQ